MTKKRFLAAALAAATLFATPYTGVFAEETTEEVKLITIGQIGGKEGNIFYDGENVILTAGITNTSDKTLDISADYTVIDYDGDEIFAGEIGEFTLNAGETQEHEFEFEVPEYNTYKLIINAESDDAVESDYIEFSNVVLFKGEKPVDAFGVGTHFTQKKGGEPNINLGIINKTGSKWIRDDIPWGGIELEKGVYSFEFYDAIFEKAIANGLNVLPVITYGCKYYDEGNAPFTEEGIAAYAKMCGAVAEHYKGKIDHFEIWNEYNGGMGNPLGQPPEVYAKMLKAAYIEIKKANPDATVIGCGTSLVDHGWIERVLKEVGVDYMDAVSVHPYTFPASPESAGLEQNITLLHEMLENYGKDMPVWYTEYGYPTYPDCVTEDIGSAHLIRGYVMALSMSMDDKVFWYDFQNDIPPTDTDREGNFGLIEHESEFYAAKQTLLAHANIVNKLSGRTFSEFVQVNDNVVAYKFEGEEDMMALWTLVDTENCSVKVNSDVVTVTDYLGNEREIYAQNGWITIPTGTHPVLVEGDFGTEITSARIASNDTVDIAAGEAIDFAIERNAEDSAAVYKLVGEIPEGISVNDVSFAAGATSANINIKTDRDAENKVYQLNFAMMDGEKNLGEFAINVNVVADRKVTIKPVILDTKDWDEWAIDVIVENNSGLIDFGGTVSVTGPEDYAAKYQNMEFETISYGEEAVVRIPVDTAPSDALIPLALDIKYSDGREEQIERNINCLAVVKTDKPITLDGVLSEDEWGNAMEFKIADRSQLHENDGESDLSGKGALMWDKNHLYMGFEITDDIHCQDQDGQGMWSADGLQIVVDPGRRNGIGSISWNELGFSLKDGKTVGTWRWQSVPGKAGGKVFGIEANVVRNEDNKTTTYEISALWEEVLPTGWTIDKGDLFGFSICANENDGAGRQGWIKYMGGIADVKEPKNFGDAVLIDLDDTVVEEMPIYDDGYMWAHESVHNLYTKKIIENTVETYFCGESIKAGEFATALLKALGKTDSSWKNAVEMGIASGEAEAVLSRQDMMVMLEKAITVDDADVTVLNVFSDAAEVAEYAKQSIANLVSAGVIVGDGQNSLRPFDNANKAEAAVVINKILK